MTARGIAQPLPDKPTFPADLAPVPELTDEEKEDAIRYIREKYGERPTLHWVPLGRSTRATGWTAITHTAEAGLIDSRIVRRNGSWWLYAVRSDGAAARTVYLHANITKAKRIAETALAEPWLLEWPADHPIDGE